MTICRIISGKLIVSFWFNRYTANKFVHAVIIEKKKDHCLALTEGNENPGQNDLKIWIDEDTEMDFFDEDMIRTLSRY